MSDFTFIHASDLHLDSPLRGLERYEGAPVDDIRGATRKALGNLVELAIREQVAFVLIAGDVYDGDWPDYNTGLHFNSRMAELARHGVQAFLVRGNHDAQSRMSRELATPGNVKRFSERNPESAMLDDLGVAIHGMGFRTADVSEDLSQRYPDPVPGALNIGLLHTSATGREGHEPYAPCDPARLASHGYDYWALGHVHRAETLNTAPWIVFSGNTQGRHARETGPKGCRLVRVTDGHIAEAEFVPLDVVRWEHLEVTAGPEASASDAMDAVGKKIEEATAAIGDRLLAARVTLRVGERARRAMLSDTERWTAQIRSEASQHTDGQAWLEKVLIEPVQAAADGPVEATEDALDAVQIASDGLRRSETLTALFADLRAKLPGAAARADDGMDLASEAWLASRLGDAEALLAGRMAAGAGAGVEP
ncbi:MAG: DNA repair exonuclease [Armatimonadetes bacterium]|nr:DNA repair exonuclease [Armatimonadota bacterium]